MYNYIYNYIYIYIYILIYPLKGLHPRARICENPIPCSYQTHPKKSEVSEGITNNFDMTPITASKCSETPTHAWKKRQNHLNSILHA